MPYLYIVGLNDGTHYCGIARDVVKRITDHQKGRSKSTRRKLPLVTKYIKQVDLISEARVMEIRIKKQGVTRWWVKNQGRVDNLLGIQTANSQQPTTSATQIQSQHPAAL